jgi:hypothetical protein
MGYYGTDLPGLSVVSFHYFIKTMAKELYFDISSAQSGGSLFRITEGDKVSFYYNHSTYDDNKDELRVFETYFVSFEEFWLELKRNPEWYYLHPLFIHNEQRDFIREELKTVNWSIYPDKKWQESHQRQWKKVLTGPSHYYRPDI